MAKKLFKVKELAPDVHVLINFFVCTCLFVGRERALLYDTGYGYADLPGAVREITGLPLDVVVSHGHFDHAGGVNTFSDPVFIHEADLPTAERHLSYKYRKLAVDSVRMIQRILFWIKGIPKGLDEESYCKGGASSNYIFVREGHVFDLGGWQDVQAESFADLAALGVTQSPQALDTLWVCTYLVPAIGAILAGAAMLFYTLKDKDAELMAQCNAGQITREKCEARLSRKY